METRELIRRYESGARFECGCEEQGLHPAVERALLDGRLKPADLMSCPVHKKRLIEESDAATASAATLVLA
jgi:hypothetical protein